MNKIFQLVGRGSQQLFVLLTVLLLAAGITGCAAMATSEHEKEVAPIAEKFLQNLDEGNVQEASKFIATGKPDRISKFVEWVNEFRAPMGRAKSRKFWGASYYMRAAGRPDGEYFEINYRTNFEHKDGAIEHLVAQKTGERWAFITYSLY